ncbi:MAG: pyridoxal phosphate-dependent aminotransferase [Pseudomonadales bacterium]|nr:pyridoxal phosphate-dependent aminotransferase [Pseudomonadales bacterium]
MIEPKKSTTPKLVSHPRQAGLVASATLVINERRQRLLAEGNEIFNFGLGQSPFPVPQPVVRALQDNAHQKDYLPVRGLPVLRESVCNWFLRRFGLQFDPVNILIAPGSKELLFLVQMALDSVLILPSPSWVSYHPQSRMAGNAAIWVDTKESDGWCLTPQALRNTCEGQLQGKTGILLLNYPNNPVGTSYTEEELVDIAQVARELGLVILSDEIYAEVDHLGEHISIARHYPEGTIVTTGLSKWCGAGGWRLGVAAFPDTLSELADSVAIMASETYTSTSAPIQYAAITAFQENPEIECYLKDSRKILRFVQRYVRDQLLECGVSVPEGTGGFYLFCNFESLREALEQKGISNSNALAEALIQETGVVSLPGTVFGRRKNELVLRLSYVDFDGEIALKNVNLIDADKKNAVNMICPRIELAMQRLSTWISNLL